MATKARELANHSGTTDNPHAVTKADVGLGNVTNDAQLKLADKATETEAEAGTADKFPDAAGVHKAFNQFGLGGYTNDGINVQGGSFNDFTKGGFYSVAGSVTEAPIVDDTPAYVLMAVGRAATYTKQVAFVSTGQKHGKVYFREQHSGTWGPWREIYHQGSILGTVSQSAGVPTGAIIERGSNANGEYTKFADGTLICYVALGVISGITISTLLSSGATRGSGEWTYPATFISSPSGLGVQVSGNVNEIGGVAATGISSCTIMIVSLGGGNITRQPACGVIGRWF